MYGPTRDTLLAGCLDQGVEQTEGVDLGLQVVVEHGLEGRHLWVHHHDIGSNACPPQGHALVGYSHCQIVHTVLLQRLRHLYCTSSVGIGLHHTHHLRFRLQERTVVVQVVYHGTEVHLKGSLVYLLLQQFRDMLKAETS